MEVKLHVFLTSTLDGGEWSALHSDRFIPWERASGLLLDKRLDGTPAPSGNLSPCVQK